MLLQLFFVATVLFLPGLHATSEREGEDALLDKWLREQMTDGAASQETYGEDRDDNLGFASPGHAEEQDFMTAFFQNQDHGDFAGEAVENYGDAEVEDYLADFFGDSATTQENKEENGDVEQQKADEDFDSWLQEDEDLDSWLQGEDEDYDMGGDEEQPKDGTDNDLFDAWLQEDGDSDDYGVYQADDENSLLKDDFTKGFPDDDLFGVLQDEEQESDMDEDGEDEAMYQFKKYPTGDLLTEEFNNNFPEDDLFATIQAERSPKCKPFEDKIKAEQTKVNTEGKKLQAKLAATQKELDIFKKEQEQNCQKKCETVCIPAHVGEECVEKTNSTCKLTQPKIDECARRIPSPKCKAEIAECEGKKEARAKKIKTLTEELQDFHTRIEGLSNGLQKMFEKVPKDCLK